MTIFGAGGVNMVYLTGIFMVLASCLVGKGTLTLLYGKTKRQNLTKTDALITGFLVCIGIGEAAHLAGLFLHWHFSDCAVFWGLAVTAAGIVGAILLLWDRLPKNDKRVRKRSRKGRQKSNYGKESKSYLLYQVLTVLAGILILIQMIVMSVETPVYLEGDMTLESVNSFLASDAVYQVNPLTGTAFEIGMPLRIQVLSLPTLYGSISYLFHIDAKWAVWTIVPVFVLGCGYLVSFQIGGILFSKSKTRQVCFLIFVILLMWAGDYCYGMDGFNILHSGFRGVSIRGMVLVPYTISAALRKRWKLAVLCILAEICMVWTFYGMGVCLLVAAGIWLAGIPGKHLQKAGLEPVQFEKQSQV